MIGRHKQCHVQVVLAKQLQVSNRHCVIDRQLMQDGTQQVWLTDLSTNGTHVNGRLVGRN